MSVLSLGTLLFLAVLLLFCAAWILFASGRIRYPIRYVSVLTPADFGLIGETLSLRSADGLSLAGWLIRHPSPRGIFLLLHGFGGSKAELLDVAAAFRTAGNCHLILIDFRGHGESDPSPVSFGRMEVRDVEAVLSYLAHEESLRALPVGCFGLSMGGAVAVLAAGLFPQIRALVLDSVYADLGNTVARAQRLTYHIPQVPLGQAAVWMAGKRMGSSLKDLSPVHAVKRLRKLPVLVIHGGRDATVPVEQGRELFESAEGPAKQWWLVEEAEHAACYYHRKQEYPRRVMEFLEDGLRRPA